MPEWATKAEHARLHPEFYWQQQTKIYLAKHPIMRAKDELKTTMAILNELAESDGEDATAGTKD